MREIEKRPGPLPAGTDEDPGETEQRLIGQLGHLRKRAPNDLLPEIMKALPLRPPTTWRGRILNFWPAPGRWFLPALAGAAAAVLIMASVVVLRGTVRKGGVEMVFRLHAPAAHSVALAGSFNGWQPGQLVLKGPDAAGYWTTTVRLPEGRHEYLFVVDGREWIADPEAVLSRPDGFGRQNAMVHVVREDAT